MDHDNIKSNKFSCDKIISNILVPILVPFIFFYLYFILNLINLNPFSHVLCLVTFSRTRYGSWNHSILSEHSLYNFSLDPGMVLGIAQCSVNIADTISLGTAASVRLVPRVSVLVGAQWEFVEYNTLLKEIKKKSQKKKK